jgi:ketosteroid isomerase-like protein
LVGDAEQELVELEHRFMAAVRDRDVDFLERHLGREFTLTTGRPGSEVRTRAEWLEITRARYEIDSFSFDELEVLPYGDAGVVRSRYRQSGRMDGDDRSVSYLMTDVWVRRSADWQLVTRHISPLAL